MALTHEIETAESPIASFFSGRFPNLKPVYAGWNESLLGVETLKPSGPVPWGTVGMAIDYRLRYYLGITPWTSLVASAGALHLTGTRQTVRPDGSVIVVTKFDPAEGPSLNQQIWLDRVDEFSQDLKSLLEELSPVRRRLANSEEEILCRYCYTLALFEELFRSRQAQMTSPLLEMATDSRARDLLSLTSQVSVDDLCAMSWKFYETQQGLLRKTAILNPIFSGSREIGGADADLIVDQCLIEIKATVDPSRQRKPLIYQLLGYAFLDYEDEFEINEVAVYLARQGVLLTWPLEELMSTLAGESTDSLSTIRDSFQEIVRSLQPVASHRK